MARALGIDHGDRRFGVAISDFGASLASPRKVVEGEEALLRYLQELIPQEEVATIVVGLPLNMDGTTGEQAKKVLAFVERLSRRFGIPVETCDERLSSFQAEGLLAEAGCYGRRRKERLDAAAAQVILQAWLDRQKNDETPVGDS